jgi:hypothetical protein
MSPIRGADGKIHEAGEDAVVYAVWRVRQPGSRRELLRWYWNYAWAKNLLDLLRTKRAVGIDYVLTLASYESVAPVRYNRGR